MTYAEIMAAIKGDQKRAASEIKLQASMIHQLGSLIGIAVNDPKKYPKLKDTFPKLFKEEFDDRQQDWQITKARVNQYNTYLKQKRGEKV